MALDERTQIAHLLRRAGFGATPEELDRYLNLGLRRTVDLLVDYEQIPWDINADLEWFDRSLPSNGLMRPRNQALLQTWWWERMVWSPRPLQEKMVFFWTQHFTTAARKVDEPVYMLNQQQFLRWHALGDIETLLKGISKQPAMMIYLDTDVNSRRSPNENYARELFELYGLGIGNYSERDIKEAARAFTGWRFTRQGVFFVDRAEHDPGPKTVFGRTGNFGGDDIVDLIMSHPAMPEFFARKLWEFFAYQDPQPEELEPVVDALKQSRFSVRAAMRALLTSPHFYSDRAYRANIKTPVELVIGTHRLLQLRPQGQMTMTMAAMGQNPWDPPNPDGWDPNEAWLNPTTWLNRINFANTMSARSPVTSNLEVEQFLSQGVDTAPDRAIDELLGRFVDGRMTPLGRAAMVQYAGARLDEPKARGLLYLVLASPEYQLA
jgi:uncharacterized protein (DUF1800 family)